MGKRMPTLNLTQVEAHAARPRVELAMPEPHKFLIMECFGITLHALAYGRRDSACHTVLWLWRQ